MVLKFVLLCVMILVAYHLPTKLILIKIFYYVIILLFNGLYTDF